MFGNLTRGGQIILHQFRMLKQITSVGIRVGIMTILGCFGIRVFMQSGNHDWSAAYSYLQAYLYQGICNYLPLLGKPGLMKTYRVNWGESYELFPYIVLNHRYYDEHQDSLCNMLCQEAEYAFILGVVVMFITFVMWGWYGAKKSAPDQTKGTKVYTPKEVASLLKKLKISSDLKIADMPLVKDKETSHILITGTTGSGKSNCMHNLLPQIRKKGQPAIIVDFTGEMVERYYDKNLGDVILNPFDERSENWDFWQEVKLDSGNICNTNLEIVSKALFTPDDTKEESFWYESAEVIFQDSVESLLGQDKRSMSQLNNMLAKIELKELGRLLKNSYSSPYLDPSNEKTAASIRSNLATSTKPLRYLKDVEKGFCLRDYIANIDGSSGWLFLSASASTRSVMRPLVSMWLDIITNRIMTLSPNYDRRLWLIIDELPALKKVPALPTALAEFRKYGGCILAGMQSANQLYKLYGHNDGLTMLDQFNTKFIFRTEENNFASYICKNFGDIEYTETQESLSYGSHEMRDGVNFSKIERVKPLMKTSDLASLADLEAYVKLPHPQVRACKLKMDYVPFEAKKTKEKEAA